MHCVLARVAQPCRFSPQSRDLNADGLIRVTQFCLSKLARLTSEVQRLAGLTRPVEGTVIKITTLRISDDVALQSLAKCTGWFSYLGFLDILQSKNRSKGDCEWQN